MSTQDRSFGGIENKDLAVGVQGFLSLGHVMSATGAENPDVSVDLPVCADGRPNARFGQLVRRPGNSVAKFAIALGPAFPIGLPEGSFAARRILSFAAGRVKFVSLQRSRIDRKVVHIAAKSLDLLA